MPHHCRRRRRRRRRDHSLDAPRCVGPCPAPRRPPGQGEETSRWRRQPLQLDRGGDREDSGGFGVRRDAAWRLVFIRVAAVGADDASFAFCPKPYLSHGEGKGRVPTTAALVHILVRRGGWDPLVRAWLMEGGGRARSPRGGDDPCTFSASRGCVQDSGQREVSLILKEVKEKSAFVRG